MASDTRGSGVGVMTAESVAVPVTVVPVSYTHLDVYKRQVLGLAEVVERALELEVKRERKAGKAIDENAVVNVSAGGVVSGQRRRTLPHLAAAAGVLVIAIAESLVGG